MPIKRADINLETFLEKFTPTTLSEPGKIQISDAEFLIIASLLKLDFTIGKIR